MQLKTNPDNPRTISKDRYEKLKRSIERNPDGLTANKIAYKDGIIISGNQRYRALLELGLEMKREYFKNLTGWTQEQIDEWIIQSNISAGEWDWDKLANEWDAEALEEWGVDVDWTTTELPDNIDETPEPPKTPISKPGDVWLLGKHRVMCGDSTDQATIERLMDGKKADMVFTDPPYGMNLDTDYSKIKGSDKSPNAKGYKWEAVIGDDQDFDPRPFLEAFSYCKEQIWWGADYYFNKLPDGGSLYVWQKRDKADSEMIGNDFEIAWSKTRHTKATFWKRWVGFDSVEKGEKRVHPTQKPISLVTWCLDQCKAGKIIADLFLGSGSTLIACEQTDRICYGLELDPAYIDVICKRYQQHTGIMPILEETGEAYDFTA